MSATIVGADLFCGSGGSTTGLRQALESLGYRVSVTAINHWNIAVATHKANHPEFDHFCTDLTTTDPTKVIPGGHLDVLWASPTCRFYSRASSKKPTGDQQRMDPWVVQRWLTELDVDRLIVENVPEIRDWGPLCTLAEKHSGRHDKDGHAAVPSSERCHRPDPAHRGEYFQAWVKSLWMLGYEVEWRVLNAADFGEATTRIRFFLQAKKRGQRIVWPNATHCRRGSREMFGGRRPWRAAAEVLDLENTGHSIFKPGKRGAQGKNGPLAVNTRLRMARGLERFSDPRLAPLFIDLLDLPADKRARFIPTPDYGGDIPRIYTAEQAPDANAFIPSRHSNDLVRTLDEPVPTVTGSGAGYLTTPFILGNRANNVAKSTDEPVPGITTAGGGGVTLTTPFVLAQGGGGEARPIDQPLPTIVTKGAISRVQPTLVQYNGNSDAQSVDEPLGAVTTRDRFGLASPVLVNLRGTSDSAIDSTAQSVDEPLQTISTQGHHGLASPMLIHLRGTEPSHLDASADGVDEPLRTLTGGGHHGLLTPLVHSAGGPEVEARSIDEPMPTLLTRDRLALTTPVIITHQDRGQPQARSIDQPLPTITTVGRQYLATPFMTPGFGERDGQEPRLHSIDEPVPTVTAQGHHHLVSPMVLGYERRDDTAKSVADPLTTIHAGGNGHSLVSPAVVQIDQAGMAGGGVRSIDEPLQTAITKQNLGLVNPVVLNMSQTGRTDDGTTRGVDEPLPTVTTRCNVAVATPTVSPAALVGIDPRRLVYLDDVLHLLDMHFRMLIPKRELAPAMGFPDDYVFVGTQADVTKQIGNAVSVRTARALVEAAFSEAAEVQTAEALA